MNPANISREEALARSTVVSVSSYNVLVDLSGRTFDGTLLAHPTKNFVSRSKMDLETTGGRFWIDIIADEIVKFEVDNQLVDVADYDGHRIWCQLPAGRHQVQVEAVCRYSNSGQGLHRFVDPADERVYLYTQFESADARRMYANFEQPNMKATFKLSVIANNSWTAISNSPTPEPTKVDSENNRWDFAATKPISTYITALCAGPYHRVDSTYPSVDGPVPASCYCRQSMAEFLDHERIFDITGKGFEVYEKHFNIAYPFGKYDTVFVPEYNAGAMENAGCVTVRDEYLYRAKMPKASYATRDNTFLHELAHMWFGDLVTMNWWDDLWLNESFAEWAASWCQYEIAKVYGGDNPWTAFTNHRKHWANNKDQLPTTHPIAADMYDLEAVDNNFDGITYAKGASVLKQLVAQVGQDAFLAGVRDYLAANQYQNATLDDLLTALQQASGRDLSWFTEQWLQNPGINTIWADFDVDDSGCFTRFDIVQSAPDQWPTLRNHRLGIGLYQLENDQLTRTEYLEVDIAGERTSIEEIVGHKRTSLVLLNDQDITYTKVRLDEASLDCVKHHLAKVSDDLTRALLWSICQDMCRDGEINSADYIDIVLNNVGSETDSTGYRAQLNYAIQAGRAFTKPAGRDDANRKLTAGFAKLLKQAAAGSDQQISAANALINVSRSAAATELLTSWLRGKEVPAGLEIDQDRRWLILQNLAAAGAINEVEVAAELHRDRSISGVEAGAGVMAAMNDAEAKAEAWDKATAQPIPNGTHRAICQSFMKYGQEDILAGYQDRYLDMVKDISAGGDLWSARSHGSAAEAINGLFPLPDEKFIDKLDSWLETNEIAEWVKALVSDNRDFALRSLNAQRNS